MRKPARPPIGIEGEDEMSKLAAFERRVLGVHGQKYYWRAADIHRLAAHYKLTEKLVSMPAPSIQRAPKTSPGTLVSPAAPRTYTFVASTPEIDRMKDSINQDGWDLKAFKRNPVILGFHDAGSLPVGKALSVGVRNGRLMVDVAFASTGLGRTMASMIDDGFMRAVSVGFIPLSFDFAKGPGRAGGIDFHACELLEVSVVPIPANANCGLVSIVSGDGKAIIVPRQLGKPERLKEIEKRERELDVIRLRHAAPAKRRAR
jgi:phage head maturation protease